MTFIDTNLTFSKQFCDIAVGTIMGSGIALYQIGRILFILLGFYAVYRITEIFIRKYKMEKKQ